MRFQLRPNKSVWAEKLYISRVSGPEKPADRKSVHRRLEKTGEPAEKLAGKRPVQRRPGRIPVLAVRPADRKASSVGVLWIHGGGYILGMKEMVYMGRAMDLIREFGVTVFSPGYRLAWQKPYPAAVRDCFAVLKYMHENRKKLGFERIMVGGESAGGGLCAAVCMMARDRGIPVELQMPLYPMLDNRDTETSRDNHGKIWNTRRNHLGWRLYLRGAVKKRVPPYASPAQQTDYKDLPPCITFVGDGEPFFTETLQYVKNLRAAGVEAEADVYHTNMHAFDMLRPGSEPAEAARQKFLERFGRAIGLRGTEAQKAAAADAPGGNNAPSAGENSGK